MSNISELFDTQSSMVTIDIRKKKEEINGTSS